MGLDHRPTSDEPRPEAAGRPKFVRRNFTSKLSREEIDRQGRAARAAWSAWSDRDAVMAFLNDHHPGLGGRPLDLAVASAEGLLAVEQAIAAGSDRASAAGGPSGG